MKAQKYSYEVKVNAVLTYERKEGSWASIAKQLNASKYTVRDWWRAYQSMGFEGLKPCSERNHFTDEIKISAIQDYLLGRYSLYDICEKYKISQKSIFTRWIRVYNSHNELNSKEKRSMIMTKGRKVTLEEKLEIVRYCIDNGRNYYAAMDKYNVSYQQIYSWVKKFEQNGKEGLIDRRGKAKPESEMTELDRLRLENRKLVAKNAELEMENRIIKKLREVERRRR